MGKESSFNSKNQPHTNRSSDSALDFKEISSDDYYLKNKEFRFWLTNKKEKYFDELDHEDQRYYFDKFVSRWNKRKLEDKYYSGDLKSGSSEKTRFNWKFADPLRGFEMDERKASNSKDSRSKHSSKSSNAPYPQGHDDEDRKDRERISRKQDFKREKRDRTELLEELVPKATGREAQLEKRRSKAEYTRREKSPDVELNDKDLMGGDDFSAALARQKRAQEFRNSKYQQKQEQRAEVIKDKVAQYQAKEQATIDMLKQLAANRFNQNL